MLLPLALLLAVIVLGLAYFKFAGSRKAGSAEKEKLAAKVEANVGQAQVDVEYFDRHLSNESTHMDVLFYVATCPDLIRLTKNVLKNVSEVKEKKAAILRGEDPEDVIKDKKSAPSIDLDDSGWADSDDEDEAAQKAKKADEEKELQRKQLAAATGKLEKTKEEILKVKFEDMDEGVLGQKWVENVLQSDAKAWPPTMPGLKDQRNYFEDENGKKVEDPLDSPAVRRNLCMLMGRLYSQVLNTHPDLIEAGPAGNLDASYFRYSMDFRQRNGLLLEAALRMALANRSFQLSTTIIESICMFKVGTASATDKKNVNWFNSVILKTYGGLEGLPRLKVKEKVIDTPEYPNIATGDTSVIGLTIERTHAEKFVQHKLELCKKQNMDPRMAMAAYQEGWWVLVRARNMDKPDEPLTLVSAWPFLVRNIAQKAGKIKCKFQVPDTPGKYKFLFDIKSQDFLGADQKFEMDVEILDRNDVERKEEESDSSDEEDSEDEGKKEK